jgi:hypothetical protein
MLTETIYNRSATENVNIKPYGIAGRAPSIPAYKFRRLNRDKTFWTAWNTGNLEDKSKTKVIYKLASAMRWARFTKPETLHMLKSWHRRHRSHYDPAQLELIYIAVDDWLRPKMRERKRLEMQRYRERQRQQKALEAVQARVAGGHYE